MISPEWYQLPMESDMTSDARSGLPRRREPDLADLATFTVDAAGVVTSWPGIAARLFELPAREAVGRDVCEVLLTSPGQPELVRDALTEVAAGRMWSATVAGGRLGEGRFAVHCMPLTEPVTGDSDGRTATWDRGGAMVVVRRAWPRSAPGWLAEAAVRIGRTLDLGQTASEVVEIAVPAFADAAAIYVAEHLLTADEAFSPRFGPGTAVRRLAGRLDGDSTVAAESLMPPGEVIIFDPGTPGFRAMATGQAVQFGQLDDRTAERIGGRPGGSQAADRYTSFLAMPLIARGTVVGCLVLGRTTVSPPFGPGELTQAGELASRAAVYIDNARLYHRERRTALALQHGLLSREPEVPPGIEIAHHYVPVGSNIVGGDWHDVIALPEGRAVVIVGDAMGHGPEAAAAMAQLRTAAHALADQALAPRLLMRGLDRLVASVTTAPFATCVCAVIDPLADPSGRGASFLASRAGHPPPVLLVPGKRAQVLDLPAGLPLGLGETSFEEIRFALPPGAVLAIYTDGLVESRARAIDDGMAELCHALESAFAVENAALDAACESVAERLSKHGEDDITLVLVRADH
jgi:serine phosphatase RsbU (regulator of sigma subunit)